MRGVQSRVAKAELPQPGARAHIAPVPTRTFKAHPMFHHDDHLRLTGCTGLRSLARGETAGVRARPRTTDVEAFLDRAGLAGRARKR